MPYDLEKFREENPAFQSSSLREIATSLYDRNKADFEAHGIRSVDDWADQYGLKDTWKKDDKRLGKKSSPTQDAGERGTLASVASSVTRGVYGAGEMGLRFMRSLPGGPKVGDQSTLSKMIAGMQEYKEESPFLQPSQEEGWGGDWRQGVESAVTSLSTAAPGAVIGGVLGSSLGPLGTAGGAWVGGQISRILGAPMFGVAEYDSYVEEGLKSDKFKRGEITREEIESAGMRSGFYETAFEFGSNVLEAIIATPGIGKLMGAPAKQAYKQSIKQLVSGGIKGTRNRIIKTLGAEVPSELVTAALQAGEYNLLTDDEQSWFDAAKEALGPAMVASLIFGGMADIGFRSGVKGHVDVLSNADAEIKDRLKSVDAIGKELDVVAPQYAQEWRLNATSAVQNGQSIGEDLVNNEELSAPGEGLDVMAPDIVPVESDMGVGYAKGVAARNDMIRKGLERDPHYLSQASQEQGPGAVASYLFEDFATQGLAKQASLRQALQDPSASIIERLTAVNAIKQEMQNTNLQAAQDWSQYAGEAVYAKHPIELDESLSEFEIDDLRASDSVVESTGNQELDDILGAFLTDMSVAERSVFEPVVERPAKSQAPTASQPKINPVIELAKQDKKFNSLIKRFEAGEKLSKEEDIYITNKLSGRVEEAVTEGGIEQAKIDKKTEQEAAVAKKKMVNKFGKVEYEASAKPTGKITTTAGNEFSIKKINKDKEGKPESILVKTAKGRERLISDVEFAGHVAAEQKRKRGEYTQNTVKLPTKTGYKEKTASFVKFGEVPESGQPSNAWLTGTDDQSASTAKGWFDEETGKFVVQGDGKALATGKQRIFLTGGKGLPTVGVKGETLLDPGTVKVTRELSPGDIVTEQDPWMDITGKELPEDQVPDWEKEPVTKEREPARQGDDEINQLYEIASCLGLRVG